MDGNIFMEKIPSFLGSAGGSSFGLVRNPSDAAAVPELEYRPAGGSPVAAALRQAHESTHANKNSTSASITRWQEQRCLHRAAAHGDGGRYCSFEHRH